jgi:hypothetical protein
VLGGFGFVELEQVRNYEISRGGEKLTRAVLLSGARWLKYTEGLVTVGLLKLFGPPSTSTIFKSGLAFASLPAATHAAVPPPAKIMSTSPTDSLYVDIVI